MSASGALLQTSGWILARRAQDTELGGEMRFNPDKAECMARPERFELPT